MRLPARIAQYQKIPANQTVPTTLQVTHEAMLCEVQFWSEEDWANLPADARPAQYTHKPGVGWVGIVPVSGLN